MSTLLTVKQVKSLTIGFALPETYDMSRVEEIKVYLGKNVYPHTIDERVVKCQIKSDDTAVMYGANRLSFWLDDSIIGVYPVYCGDIVFEYTNAIEHNESVNTVFDLLVNLSISETAITVGDVLYNYVKGDKGDPFLYSDFTPEQIAELQQPAADAIASIEAVEQSVEQAEGLRVTAEQARQTNTATAIQSAETATTNANDAAGLANAKADLANDAALLANEKAGLAETATTQANTARDGANLAAESATNLVNSYATDLAAKELKANKQNNLTTDGTGTKFPTVDAVNEGLMPKLTGLDVLGYKNQRVTLIPQKIKELRWWANKGIWVGRRVDVAETNIYFYDNNLTQIGKMNIMGGHQQQSYFCLGDYVYFIHWYNSSNPFKIIAMGLNYGITDITATLPTVDTTKRFGFAVIDDVPLFIANDSVNVLNFTTPLVPTITSTISIPNMNDYLIGATQESVIINTDTRVLVIDKTLAELMTANYPAGQTARRLTISPEKIPYFIIATSNFIYTRANATFNAFTISMTGDNYPVFISTKDRSNQGWDIMIWYNSLIRKYNIATGKNYVTFSELYNELTFNVNNFILGGTIYSILENIVYLIYSDIYNSAIIINLNI